MAGYGMVILGPSLHFWFNFVSKLLPRRDLLSTLKKMVMGQTLYGPAMTVVFFSLNARLQGMSSSLSIIFYHKISFCNHMFLCVCVVLGGGGGGGVFQIIMLTATWNATQKFRMLIMSHN